MTSTSMSASSEPTENSQHDAAYVKLLAWHIKKKQNMIETPMVMQGYPLVN
jgi:hypothetical protein